MNKEASIPEILATLIHRGWIPLAKLTPLLGLSHPNNIYQRLRASTKPNIQTIKVGGILRVEEKIVLKLFNEYSLKGRSTEHAQAVHTLYSRMKIQKDKRSTTQDI